MYAIYYSGDFEPYAPLSAEDCVAPVYVGKADMPGGRKGKTTANPAKSKPLFNRLKKHAVSIEQADNLVLSDFRCRYLIVNDLWVPLGEDLPLRQFQPLWNQVVDGFGMNVPGKPRHGGLRSDWDELHPGRPWYPHMIQKRTPDELTVKVGDHLATTLALPDG